MSATIRSMSRSSRPLIGTLASLALAIGLLSGCPRSVGTPDPPEDGLMCSTVADCNEGRVCGELSACVDGHCEDGRSLEIPCPATP